MSNSTTPQPQTAQQAATFLVERLPKFKDKGLRTIIPLSTGEEICINPVDMATLQGTLAGIAEGRISWGDGRLHHAINGLMSSLNNAEQLYSKPADSEHPWTSEQENKNNKTVIAINHIASGLMYVLYMANRFGLTVDKMPLQEMVQERAMGFGSDEPGPTGRFVDRLR